MRYHFSQANSPGSLSKIADAIVEGIIDQLTAEGSYTRASISAMIKKSRITLAGEVVASKQINSVPVIESILEKAGYSEFPSFNPQTLNISQCFTEPSPELLSSINLISPSLGCLDIITPVLTDKGYKFIRDIKPGDKVKYKGKDYEVTNSVSKGVKDCYLYGFSDGTSLRLTDDHPVMTNLGLVAASAMVRGIHKIEKNRDCGISERLCKFDIPSALIMFKLIYGKTFKDQIKNPLNCIHKSCNLEDFQVKNPGFIKLIDESKDSELFESLFKEGQTYNLLDIRKLTLLYVAYSCATVEFYKNPSDLTYRTVYTVKTKQPADLAKKILEQIRLLSSEFGLNTRISGTELWADDTALKVTNSIISQGSLFMVKDLSGYKEEYTETYTATYQGRVDKRPTSLWDISVKEVNMFYANGIAVHNSSDQCVVTGAAVKQAPDYTEYSDYIARKVSYGLFSNKKSWKYPDNKVSVITEHIDDSHEFKCIEIVVSQSHTKGAVNVRHDIICEVKTIIENLKPVLPDVNFDAVVISVNVAGNFTCTGPEFDTGVSNGRRFPGSVAGFGTQYGLFGLDPTKVEKAGTYMMRYLAKRVVALGMADFCVVEAQYCVGTAQPTYINVKTFGKNRVPMQDIENFVNSHSLRISDIIERFGLNTKERGFEFADLALYNYIGEVPLDIELPWEKIN